jgi:hypothetical protein
VSLIQYTTKIFATHIIEGFMKWMLEQNAVGGGLSAISVSNIYRYTASKELAREI